MSLLAGIVADLLLYIWVTQELAYALIPAFPLAIASIVLATKAHTAAARNSDSLSLNLADAGFLFGAPAALVCVGLTISWVMFPSGAIH